MMCTSLVAYLQMRNLVAIRRGVSKHCMHQSESNRLVHFQVGLHFIKPIPRQLFGRERQRIQRQLSCRHGREPKFNCSS